MPAVAVNVAVVALAATLTEAGSVSAALLPDRPAEAPPLGAAWDNVTMQVELAPETTVDGAHCKAETAICGVIVTVVVVELPFSAAVTVTG